MCVFTFYIIIKTLNPPGLIITCLPQTQHLTHSPPACLLGTVARSRVSGDAGQCVCLPAADLQLTWFGAVKSLFVWDETVQCFFCSGCILCFSSIKFSSNYLGYTFKLFTCLNSHLKHLYCMSQAVVASLPTRIP